MDIHILIIIVTVAVSMLAFNNTTLYYRLQYNPYQIKHRNEWWRFFSHSLVHGDYTHLAVNMFVLWSFGNAAILYFDHYLHINGNLLFLLLYILALPLSSLLSYQRHGDNPSYNAVGASGAVSAVMFACIFFKPWHLLYFFGIIPIPGIIFGIAYLYYSYKMDKRGGDGIGHDAHLWGAIVGFVFPIFIKPNSILHFIDELFKLPF